MDYSTLTASTAKMEEFKVGVQASIAAAAKVPSSYVSILSVKPGSVAVESSITYPPDSGVTQAQADQAAAALVSSPATAFSSSFMSTYGITSVTAVDTTPATAGTPTTAGSDGSGAKLSGGAIAGIAVGATVGFVVVAAAITFLVLRGKRAGSGGAVDGSPAGSGPRSPKVAPYPV